MTSRELENLARTNSLKREAFSQYDFDGLVRSARRRLADAKNTNLSLESRFDLAYNASHALGLAALRWHGYRAENRYTVFQVLGHTLDLKPEQWRVLFDAHKKRNIAEYDGELDVSAALLASMLDIAAEMLQRCDALGPPPG